jgi:5-methylcytosine-specific restriction endonuclease McrA
MLKYLLFFLLLTLGAAFLCAGPRSPEWPNLRFAHIKKHPQCAACGTLKRNQVHHIIPVHLDPSQELNPENLITLCKGGCHLKLGHGGDYRAYNPNIRQDAELFKTDPAQAIKNARENRRFELPQTEKVIEKEAQPILSH